MQINVIGPAPPTTLPPNGNPGIVPPWLLPLTPPQPQKPNNKEDPTNG